MKKTLPLLLLLLLSLPSLRARWLWERSGEDVTVCVDGAELESLFPPEELPAALKALREAGVGSVGVLWDGSVPLDVLTARWSGFRVAWRPVFRKFSDGGGRPLPWEQWLGAGPLTCAGCASASPKREGFLLPAGPVQPPLGGAVFPAAALMASTNLLLPYMEFSRGPSAEALAVLFPGRAVRAHSVDEEELLRLSPRAVAVRFRRAVRERGVRFLYVHFFPSLSPRENLSRVLGLAAGLYEDGFRPGLAGPRRGAAPRGLPLPAAAIQALAFAAAVLGPWWAFRCWGRRPLILGPLSLAAALIVAAVLTSPDFLLGFAAFRGVKPALALPFLLAAAGMYSLEELRRSLARPLTVGTAALLAAAAGIGLLVLLRSGHDAGLPVSGTELRLRDFLEGLLTVRPRFKEFAVGWPLLWLGAHFAKGKKTDPRPFLLGGLVAPVSIVNTFCHAHVPLGVSLLRSFHGFWLGALVGGLLVGIASKRGGPAAGRAPRRTTF